MVDFFVLANDSKNSASLRKLLYVFITVGYIIISGSEMKFERNLRQMSQK